MCKHFLKKFVFYTSLIAFISFLKLINIYAGSIADEAESYRLKGYEAQEKGDLDNAISWYQKAAGLDSNYAAPHNDLGILFEAKGWLDRAESEYQKAIAIDHNYASAHTNLALLYERKGEVEKAAFHWMKRYRYGGPGEHWTEEARQRLERLGLIDGMAEEKAISEKKEMAPKKKTSKKFPQESVIIPAGERESDLERELQRSLQLEEERVRREKGEEKQRLDEKRIRDAEYLNSLKLAEERLKIDREKESQKERDLEREIQRSLETEEERLKREDLRKKELEAKKAKEETHLFLKPKKGDVEKELQASLSLAEERLKREKKEKKAIDAENQKKETSDTGAKAYHHKANTYYKKGEYSKALDTIRIAKKDYPDDQGLLELEQAIKNKMKEESIEDHYNEGILHYRQDDFAGARKEFEAILNILPE